MIEWDSPIPVKRQAQLLDLSRSSVYYVARSLPERDLKLMRILDELHLKWPFYGSRKLTRELQKQGHAVGRRHVTTSLPLVAQRMRISHPSGSRPPRLGKHQHAAPPPPGEPLALMSPRHNSVPSAVQDKQYLWFVCRKKDPAHDDSARGRIVKSTAQCWGERRRWANQIP